MQPIDSIITTLSVSVNKGLNVVLTPAECMELLNALKSASTSISGSPFDAIIDRLNDAAHDYINSFTGELKTPRSRIRKKKQ